MAGEIKFAAGQAGTYYVAILDRAGQVYNFDSEAFETWSDGNWADYGLALAAIGTSGLYRNTSFPALAAGTYDVAIYQQLGGNPAAGDPLLGAGHYVEEYWADISYSRSSAADQYAVQWFRGAAPITSGATDPTITVRTDSEELFSGVAMTAAGGGHFVAEADLADRLAAGDVALVTVTATIDGATRTFRRAVAR